MRFQRPATLQQLRDAAPAVFSDKPHPNMMQQYNFVPTIKILEALFDAGYGISRAQQVDSKDRYGLASGKHLIGLRHRDMFGEVQVGEYIPEIIYTGAHDGSSAIHLYAGLYRLVCANGLIMGEHFTKERIIHKAGAEVAVLTAANHIVTMLPQQAEYVDKMRRVDLPVEAQLSLARQAQALRWPNQQGFGAERLLDARRADDAGANLWRVMNRIQENLMRGGQETLSASGRRVIRTRPVEAIGSDVAINRALWMLADQFMPVEA